MTDREALLAAILADPADDTRRLAFADLLDEEGERERAEFIRVQIELARTPERRRLFVADGAGKMLDGLGVGLTPRGDGHYSASNAERGLSIESFTAGDRVDIYCDIAGKGGGPRWLHGMKYVRHAPNAIIFRRDDESKQIGGLKKRETALLKNWKPLLTWLFNGVYDFGRGGNNQFDATQGSSARILFSVELRRGFVSEVHSPLASFMRHAQELAKHPLEVVRLTDRAPSHFDDEFDGTSGWGWATRREGAGDENGAMPRVVWMRLRNESSGMADDTESNGWLWKIYRTRDDALAAMSQACIEYARSLTQGTSS